MPVHRFEVQNTKLNSQADSDFKKAKKRVLEEIMDLPEELNEQQKNLINLLMPQGNDNNNHNPSIYTNSLAKK